ncbi:MAG: ABC-2 transporter permease, partial [Thermoguttaceae bacterium]
MNRAIFWRLLWKEYRLQRAFWIAMAVLALMLMLFAWLFNNRVEERNLWFFYIAFATPVFYMLGCASTTFAGEYDAETYEFQRSLPVTAMQVFWSKIALALLSTFAIFVLLNMLAFCLAGGRVLERHVTIWEMRIWDMLVIACMGAWLYLVWGVFFSLILKRPLLAAIISVTVASMGSYVIAGIMQIPFPRQSLPMQVFVSLSVLLAIVNIFLGRGWFKDKLRPIFGINLPIINVGIKPSSKSKTLKEYMSGSNFWTILRRLTWQHWRQSRWLAIVVLVMLAPLILALIQLWLINNKY